MEWNDMSKGKWDVRSRLSAERNKLSLLCAGGPTSILCNDPLPLLPNIYSPHNIVEKLQKTKMINWRLLISHQQYQIVIILWIYQWICGVRGSCGRNRYYHKTGGKNLEPLSGLFLESYLSSYLWRTIFQSVFSINPNWYIVSLYIIRPTYYVNSGENTNFWLFDNY